jgi:hypothetical protein
VLIDESPVRVFVKVMARSRKSTEVGKVVLHRRIKKGSHQPGKTEKLPFF